MIDIALDNRVIIYDKLDAFIQELDILFNTSKTELIGNVSFGSSFVDYLWDLNFSVGEVIEYTKQLIFTNCYYSSMFSIDVDCEIIEGEMRQIYLLQITVYDNNSKNEEKQQAKKIYQFR